MMLNNTYTYSLIDDETFLIKDFRSYKWFFNDCFNIIDKTYHKRVYIPQTSNKTPEIKLVPTNSCQLSCCYCYTKRYRKKSCSDLEFYQVKDHLSRFFNHNGVGVLCFVGGGEPTSNFQLIKDCVMYAKSFDTSKKFKIITNGLFSDEILHFLVDNNFQIVISLDGDYTLMSEQQSTPYSVNNYKRTIKNLLTLLRKNSEVLLNSVITLNSINKNFYTLCNTCDYFQSLGIRKINITVDNSIWSSKLTDTDLKALIQSHIYLLEWLAKGKTIKVSSDLLRCRVNFLDNVRCSSVYSNKSFSILPSGVLSYCYNDQESGIPLDKDSSLLSNNLSTSIEYLKQKITTYRSQNCVTCIARQICFATKCPVNFKYYVLSKPENLFCKNLQAFRLGLLNYYFEQIY